MDLDSRCDLLLNFYGVNFGCCFYEICLDDVMSLLCFKIY